MSELKPLSPDHPAQSLIKGEPPERITADQNPKIVIINLHGEEELAGLVENYIETTRPDLMQHVDYICGNPPASALGVRAQSPLDDLNRSFNLPADHSRYDSPERKRADELTPRLQKYDKVLDLHTSETDCGMIFFVANPENPDVREIISCSTIDKAIIMPRSITDPTLIGNIAPAISIEMNDKVARTPEGVKEVINIIDGLIAGTPLVEPQERQFFYVERPVPKAEDPGNVTNFELCKDGYYPVLFGEGPKSYRNDPSKSYLGFAATNRQVVTL